MERSIIFLALFTLPFAAFAGSDTVADRCPSAPQCREIPPLGKLHHHNAWTVSCPGVSNTSKSAIDPICEEIAACPQAGSFGKFLKAVSGLCKEKHFAGYFGLDGMTFGILDWTAPNLPGILKAYQQRSSAGYQANFGKLNLPMHNGCLDPSWVCRANQQADLVCEPEFHSSFSAALATSDFRKAEMDFALLQYEDRLKRYSSLGLKTEYGNIALAVLANNLPKGDACRPATWKAACNGAPNEKGMVDCMLQQYLDHNCRNRSYQASLDRVRAIKAVFADPTDGAIIHPRASAVEQCVADWSK